MVTLSVCMIVKDEEHSLKRCLESIKDLASEIIIVDTGSKDKTKDIALAYTDKVFDFEWDNDFSHARNEPLNHATSDWILVLDADETIAIRDHEKMKEALQTTEHIGFALANRNYSNDSHAAGWVTSADDSYEESKVANGWYPSEKIRLFRNDSRIRYKGAVHETVYESLKESGSIGHLNIVLHHFGKLNEDAVKEKNALYEELGEKKADQEGEFHSFYELGRQYAHNGKLNEAIDALKKAVELRNDHFESLFMLGSVFLLEEEADEAIEWLCKAQTVKNNHAVNANLGVAYAKKNDLNKAIASLLKAIELNPHDAASYKNLGMCYDAVGESNKAYDALKRAVELNPKYKETITLD